MMTYRIQIKRAYEPPGPEDGYRVLVDRLWPRGVRKDDLKLDDWAKVIAPSTELREWFGHDPAKFDEFIKRYKAEVQGNLEAKEYFQKLVKQAQQSNLTLIYGSRDTTHNNAFVLAKWLNQQSS